MRFTVEFDGLIRLRAAVTRTRRQLADMRPFFREELKAFRQREAELFDSGGAAVGGWRRLSPHYAAYKARVRPGAPLMEFDGRLRDSLTKKGAAGAIERVERQSMEAGTGVIYAHRHHHGDEDAGIPARPLLSFRPDERRAMQVRLESWLAREATRAGWPA